MSAATGKRKTAGKAPVPAPAPAPPPAAAAAAAAAVAVPETSTAKQELSKFTGKDMSSYFYELYDAFHKDPNATLPELLEYILQPPARLKKAALLHLKYRNDYGNYDEWILVNEEIYGKIRTVHKEAPYQEIFQLDGFAGKHSNTTVSCTDLIVERVNGCKHPITLLERYYGLLRAGIDIYEELGNRGTIHAAIARYNAGKQEEEEQAQRKIKQGRLEVIA